MKEGLWILPIPINFNGFEADSIIINNDSKCTLQNMKGETIEEVNYLIIPHGVPPQISFAKIEEKILRSLEYELIDDYSVKLIDYQGIQPVTIYSGKQRK